LGVKHINEVVKVNFPELESAQNVTKELDQILSVQDTTENAPTEANGVEIAKG
jgi:hypothetical protein